MSSSKDGVQVTAKSRPQGTPTSSWADEVESDDTPPGFEALPSPRETLRGLGLDTTPSATSQATSQAGSEEASDVGSHAATEASQGPPQERATESQDADDVAQGLAGIGVKDKGEEGTVEGTVDQPDIAVKSQVLREPEMHETEIKKVIASDTPYSSAKSFEELSLSEALLRGLYSEMKFERPSKIQAVTLPMILQPPHADLIAQAHNGSGKTTCFVLGMLSRVDPRLKTPQALCVCPTRELAQQNESVLLRMGKYTGITCACTASESSGIVDSSEQPKLADQVVIGTLGTLKRWMTRDRILPVGNMKILVFDEADHMLDVDGFQDDSLRIINFIRKQSPKVQIVLFSATFNERVKRFASRVVTNANQVFVPREELSLDVIKQYRVRVPNHNSKVVVIRDRIFPAADKLGQTIIFVKTREDARNLHRILEQDGHKCTSIQGGMLPEQRDSVIREFRSGTTKILIATDLLSRGFDQAEVTLVVNYDLPVNVTPPRDPQYETYLHRIGRSGRFGRKGAAFNLICGERDEMNLNKIEAHFNKKIPEVDWMDDDGFENVLKEAGLA